MIELNEQQSTIDFSLSQFLPFSFLRAWVLIQQHRNGDT
jgi:hypothetical protein